MKWIFYNIQTCGASFKPWHLIPLTNIIINIPKKRFECTTVFFSHKFFCFNKRFASNCREVDIISRKTLRNSFYNSISTKQVKSSVFANPLLKPCKYIRYFASFQCLNHVFFKLSQSPFSKFRIAKYIFLVNALPVFLPAVKYTWEVVQRQGRRRASSILR